MCLVNLFHLTRHLFLDEHGVIHIHHILVRLHHRLCNACNFYDLVLQSLDAHIRALRQDSVVLFPLEVTVEIPLGSPGWINAESRSFQVAFPRYRVYLYNTSDKSVATTVYVYLTNS